MKTLKYFLMLGVMVFAATSCENNQGGSGGGETVNSTAAATGSVEDIEVATDGSWSVTSSEAWCIPSQTSGEGHTTLNVSMLPNLTSQTRTATVSVYTGGSASAKSMRRSAEGAVSTYTYTQEPATIAEEKMHITGVESKGDGLVAYLTVTGTESGEYNSVGKLSNVPMTYFNGTSVLLPGGAHVAIGTSGNDKVVLVGKEQAYANGTYTITGMEDRELVLEIGSEPACEQKIYIDQSELVRPMYLDNGSGTDKYGSAQVRFAIDDKVYFGGGYNSRNYQSATGLTGASFGGEETNAFTCLDTKTGTLKRMNNLPIELVWGSAAVVGNTVYCVSSTGSVYNYNVQNDSWSNLLTGNANRCDGLYAVDQQLYRIDIVSGTVSKYNLNDYSSSVFENIKSGSFIRLVAENESRVWFAIDKTLYVHDGQGLRQVATLESWHLISAVDGKLYYFSDNGVVSYYSLADNKFHKKAIFFYPYGNALDADSYGSYFHIGMPIMVDGVSYLLNAGYTVNTANVPKNWAGTQRQDIMRIDMRKSHKIVVK